MRLRRGPKRSRVQGRRRREESRKRRREPGRMTGRLKNREETKKPGGRAMKKGAGWRRRGDAKSLHV